MIIDQIKNYYIYEKIDVNIAKALRYIASNDLSLLEKGTYQIEDKELYYNILQYETKDIKETIWEAHKKYVDIHFILSGEEIIAYSDISDLSEKSEYNHESDYIILEGCSETKIKLSAGDFMVCFPQDAHMTGIQIGESKAVKKVVFKCKIN